jgi:hypothetical protein
MSLECRRIGAPWQALIFLIYDIVHSTAIFVSLFLIQRLEIDPPDAMPCPSAACDCHAQRHRPPQHCFR